MPARPRTPVILLTSVVFGEAAAGLSGPVSVPWGQRSLQATFAAMTFRNEDTVLFRYRIAGLTERWQETAQREVHVPSLPAGRYALEIQANAGQGAWGETGARLDFQIRPTWWRTWWFEMAAAVAAAWLGRWFWRWRLRNILRRQKELEETVADRTRKLEEEKLTAERERDLVEKQKVEIERLFHAAEQAGRLKDEFLSNMNHEIRTPLNGIIGMTELALDTPLTGEQRECLLTARGASESLLRTIEDILDFSQAEKGVLSAESQAFDPREVVAAVGDFQEPARQKGLELEWRIAPGLPRRLVGDPSRLRRVLRKLLDNATKFTERGGVRLYAGVGDDPAGVLAHFEVQDNGIGIAAEKQALIFEPFFQADGSHKRRHGGTGLGLAICARFVESKGWRIWVESELGRGSRFHFTARFARAAEPAEQARSPGKQAGRAGDENSLAILLAEENPVNRTLALRLLEKRGYTVVTAGNGVEVLRALERQRFDAVLMDVQMPEMDGFQATGEIRVRERRAGERTPIIAVTAHALEGDRERCLSAGMDDYVTKPIRAAELFAAIERHVGRTAQPD